MQIDNFKQIPRHQDYIYRGCASNKYHLIPSFIRNIGESPTTSDQKEVLKRNKIIKDYNQVFRDREKKLFNFIGESASSDSLAQHYGLGSICLDWSSSLDVALYFAFTQFIEDFHQKYMKPIMAEHDSKKLQKLIIEGRKNFNENTYRIYVLNKKVLSTIKNGFDKEPLKLDETDQQNKRMKSQKGLLTMIDIDEIDDIPINDSQLTILKKWFENKEIDYLTEKNGQWAWKGKPFVENYDFKLSQYARETLQEQLTSKKIDSIHLFPYYGGVERSTRLAEHYEYLHTFYIAYKENPADTLGGLTASKLESRHPCDNSYGEFRLF